MVATYRRPDGTVFVCDMERSVFQQRSSKALRGALRSWVSGYKKTVYLVLGFDTQGHLNARVSPQPGVGLGECVFAQLRATDDTVGANVIWCEQLPAEESDDVNHCLLVIVNDGVVVYDNLVPANTTDRDAALIISQSTSPYDMFVFGEDMVHSMEEGVRKAGCVLIDVESIARFVALERSLMPELCADKRCALLPIKEAMDVAEISNKWLARLVLVAVLMVTLLMFVWLYGQISRQIQVQTIKQDPYASYRQALQAPLAAQLLENIEQLSLQLRQLVGVRLITLSWNGNDVNASLNWEGASISALSKLLEAYEWRVRIDNSKIQVSRSLGIPLRAKVNTITSLSASVASLVDSANLAGIRVSLDAPVAYGNYFSRRLVLNYQELGLRQSDYVLELLAHYPVVIESVEENYGGLGQRDVHLALLVYGSD